MRSVTVLANSPARKLLVKAVARRWETVLSRPALARNEILRLLL